MATRDLRPLAGAVQLQIDLPVVNGLQRIAEAFAQKRQVEVSVGVVGIQRQGAPVVLQRLLQAALLIVEVSKVELGQSVTGIGLDGLPIVLFGLIEFAKAIINRA